MTQPCKPWVCLPRNRFTGCHRTCHYGDEGSRFRIYLLRRSGGVIDGVWHDETHHTCASALHKGVRFPEHPRSLRYE